MVIKNLECIKMNTSMIQGGGSKKCVPDPSYPKKYDYCDHKKYNPCDHKKYDPCDSKAWGYFAHLVKEIL
jgi:hypothetical protein